MSRLIRWNRSDKKKPELAVNFKCEEFECHCGVCEAQVIDFDLVTHLQSARSLIQLPIKVNSGYRCPAHNAATPNASKHSNHIEGIAVDCYVNGMDPRLLAAYLARYARVGFYSTFVHVDLDVLRPHFVGSY